MDDVSGKGLRQHGNRLSVAVDVANIVCVDLLLQVRDTMVAIVGHFFGDLAIEAQREFADVFFESAVAQLPQILKVSCQTIH